MNLWNDLVIGDSRIISREEIEFEIAINDELLEKREALIWKLFDSDPESVIDDLKQLYCNVLRIIEERNDD